MMRGEREHLRSERLGYGCECKVPGTDLKSLLAGAAVLTRQPGPIDLQDCAVLDPLLSTPLFTCDFSTLVSKNIRQAGRIAALHGCSDVYASGGRPLVAVVIMAVPRSWSRGEAAELLAGLLDGCEGIGVRIVGGQTVYGPEAMCGLAVIGDCQDREPLRKQGASPGDRLFLSKPLGVGLVMHAEHVGCASESTIQSALNVMLTPNDASAAAVSGRASACTDVSGYGFLGHLAECFVDQYGADIVLSQVPTIQGVSALPEILKRASWMTNNRSYVDEIVDFHTSCTDSELAPLLDPQTNGGLIVAANESQTDFFLSKGFVHVGEVCADRRISLT